MKSRKYLSKKYIFAALSTLTLFGCTLVLEQEPDDSKYAEDLELVGFDEPYTQHTEMGDVTFQYADETRLLKNKALDFLVKIEHDSVLYFSDNIPEELLIKPGHYISKGCCEQIPLGLCGKVDSLEHLAGVYRMVTSRADQEDVFKVLEMDLNLDYSPSHKISLPDEQYLEEHGYSEDSFVVVDYSYLEESPSTRGDTEANKEDNKDPEEKDEDETSKDEQTNKSIDLLTLNTGNAFLSTGDNKNSNKFLQYFLKPLQTFKDKGFDVGIVYSEVVKKKVRHTVKLDPSLDKDKTYRREETIDNSYNTLELSVTYSKDWGSQNTGGSQDVEKVYDAFYDIISDARNLSKKVGARQGPVGMIAIPVPVCPAVCFFIRIAAMYELELGIVGKVSVQITRPTVTTVVETMGKKRINEDKNKPKQEGKGGIKLNEVAATGYFKLGGGVELLFGAGAIGGLTGVGIGAYVNATLQVNLTASTSQKEFGDNSLITFKMGAMPKARVFLGSFTASWDLSYHQWDWIDRSLAYYPSLEGESNKATYMVFVDENGDHRYKVKGAYSFSNLGIIGNLHPSILSAGLLVRYTGSDGEEREQRLKREGDTSSDERHWGVKTGCSYKFEDELYANVMEGTPIIAVPYVAKGYGTEHIYENKVMKAQIEGVPVLNHLGLYLTDITCYDSNGKKTATPESEFDFSTDPKAVSYTIVTRVQLINGPIAEKQWDSWGLQYELTKFNDKTLQSESLSGRVYLPLNGIGASGVYDVSSTLYTEDLSSLTLWLYPAHVSKGTNYAMPDYNNTDKIYIPLGLYEKTSKPSSKADFYVFRNLQ